VHDRGVERDFLIGKVHCLDPFSVHWYGPTDVNVLDGTWMPLEKDAEPHIDRVYPESVCKPFEPVPCDGSVLVVLPSEILEFLKFNDLWKPSDCDVSDE